MGSSSVDERRLAEIHAREQQRFRDAHPRSAALSERATRSLLGGVPLTWMMLWSGDYPMFANLGSGARVTDVDGNTYIDMCLGDTGAMAGHSPEPVVQAVTRQINKGVSLLLPSDDSIWLGEELTRRFGLPFWNFTTSATDANRFVLRIVRQVTGRSKIIVFDHCYHGSVDEAFATIDEQGQTVRYAGSVGPAVDVPLTTKVVQFNDPKGLQLALADEDVACVLAEPALTNVGIVLPEPGYHERLRELTRSYGTYLVLDETHCISAGIGGCTRAWGLEPDAITLGKSIAGGIPAGVFGLSTQLKERLFADPTADWMDAGGIGGTLAGNILSLVAMRATLSHMFTETTFARMERLCSQYVEGLESTIVGADLPWTVVQLGNRAMWRFSRPAPRDGAEAWAARGEALDKFLQLYFINRGVLLTPMMGIALMSPATTEEDVYTAIGLFHDAARELTS